MKVCICGGGHLGHVVAGFIAAQEGNDVRMLTRRPQLWSKDIEVTDPCGKVFSGRLACVTSSAGEALAGADIVILCLPGSLIREELLRIRSHIPPKAAVGSIVSSTGFFFQAFDIFPKSQALFGFQRVPFICRTKVYGHSAELLGYKPSLNIAIERLEDKEALRGAMERLFKCSTSLMQNYYEVSLTNSNPILHTSRLYSLWHGYSEGIVYKNNLQFYSDWDDESSELLIGMDDEFQELLKLLPVRKGAIPTILDYYESTDATSLTNKLRTIKAFQGLLAPMREVPGGWVPDFGSRYFTEDFPYGLRIIHSLAHENNISCPLVDKVYEWGSSLVSETA